MDLSPRDVDLVTRTVMGEAGDQPNEGKAAVASVILNRLRSGQYGDSIPKVILQPNAFEPWSTRRSELLSYSPESKAYQATKAIVNDVVSGKTDDPTEGATHFYSPKAQAALGRRPPSWAQNPTAIIGGHNFYAPNGPVVEDLLGSWNQPSAPAVPASQSNDEDLLGAWTTPTEAPKPERLYVSPGDGDKKKPTEDLPQIANLKEHQGDSLTDRAVRLGVGGLQGVEDVANTLARGIAATGEGGANALQATGIISPQTGQAVQDWASGVRQNVLNERNAFDQAAGNSVLPAIGRIGGQILATGPALGAGEAALGVPGLMAARPLLGSAVGGAVTGAGANALTSAASDEPIGNQILQGAAAGGLLGPLGEGASVLGGGVRNALFGRPSQETAALADTARNVYGIPVTAGQISSSPASRFMDSVLQRLPFTGYGARTAEQQVAFNRAVSNTFGEDADRITPQVIQNARQRIGNAFDDVAQRTGNIQIDHPFVARLNNIWHDVQAVLPESEQRPIQRQLHDLMTTRDPITNTLSAESYQALTRKGAPLDRLSQSADPNIRHYAGQIREALDDVMGRSAPPDAVQDLLEARRQWRALKAVEPIASSKKSPSGDLSPARVATQAEKSYPRGNGPLSDLGRIGQRFLTEPSSSGTAERLANMKALATGAGIVGGLATGAYAFDPEHFQRNALLTAAALGAGRVGSAALRGNWLANSMINAGLNRPGGLNPLTNLLTRTAPAAALTYRGSTPANALAGQ